MVDDRRWGEERRRGWLGKRRVAPCPLHARAAATAKLACAPFVATSMAVTVTAECTTRATCIARPAAAAAATAAAEPGPLAAASSFVAAVLSAACVPPGTTRFTIAISTSLQPSSFSSAKSCFDRAVAGDACATACPKPRTASHVSASAIANATVASRRFAVAVALCSSISTASIVPAFDAK
mmetsp:Transcript_23622/g.51605  ORF Transcript_23622/g.51605 Transcript_23622/m.51605 type:complete len:182 (-) Transcript_23622:103-648(-)